jgi:hypothetical protein
MRRKRPFDSSNHAKTPRNSRCPCGSGRKYKKCCGSAATMTNVTEFFDTPVGRRIVEKAAQMMNPPAPSRMVSRPQIQTVNFGQKIRAVRNAIHFRPLEETFHDFQLDLLLWTLGKNWFDEQMLKPAGERHVILRWRDERNELLEKHRDLAAPPNQPVRAPMTGNIKALQVFADDIYQLQHALRTPRKIIERLRSMREFQGARYEILVASLFARCGFDIEFVDDQGKKNPEFFATKTGERIAVEAKSRRRSGVLHERGVYVAGAEPAQARIRRLFQEALLQDPGGVPFVVFIDVNLPLTPQAPALDRLWVKEAMRCFEERKCEGLPEPDSGLVLSNIGWHYHRDLGVPPPEFVTVKPEQPAFPLRSETWGLLERALNEYGIIVDEENPPKPKRKTTPGWFHYGYFVKGLGKSLRAAGESFARTPYTYKKGDSLGVRSGVEGIVASVIRAENPDLHDFDVLVVVEEHQAL